MSTIVIHQPNFLPYIGFFEQLRQCETYVAYDDVQFSENEFQNRNFIRTVTARTNLTLSVKRKGRFGQKINEVELADERWRTSLFNKIDACYAKAPHFAEVRHVLERTLPPEAAMLIDVNLPLIHAFSSRLGLEFNTILASNLELHERDRQRRVVEIIEAVGANRIVVGEGAEKYLDADMFSKRGLTCAVHRFQPREYRQTGDGFIPNLSILDYVMNVGWSVASECICSQR